MTDHSRFSVRELSPPAARQNPKIDTVHGDRRVDDYFWMRRKDDPEVTAYLTAENAYTDAVMKPTEAFQESLYAEMLARIKEDDQTVPYRRGGFFYYSRTEKGKQYSILCRKAGSLEAPEQVMLDLNALAKGHPFLSLGAASVSDDGRRLAYTTDVTGFREYTLHVKDLETGALLPDLVEKVSAVTWAADEEALLADLTRELRDLAAAPVTAVETTLLIHPRALPDFLDYNDFLHTADRLLGRLRLRGTIHRTDRWLPNRSSCLESPRWSGSRSRRSATRLRSAVRSPEPFSFAPKARLTSASSTRSRS